MLIVCKNMFLIIRLQTQLQGEFEMKDLGVAKKKKEKLVWRFIKIEK